MQVHDLAASGQPAYFALQSASIDGQPASPNQLRDLSALLTASGVNVVYNEDASDEGKKHPTPPPPSAHDPAHDGADDAGADATQGPDDVYPEVRGEDWTPPRDHNHRGEHNLDDEAIPDEQANPGDDPTAEGQEESGAGESVEDNRLNLPRVGDFASEIVVAQPDPDDPDPEEELVLYRHFFSQASKKVIDDQRDKNRTGSATGTPTPLPPLKKTHTEALDGYIRIKHERRAGYILAQTEDVIFQPKVKIEDGLSMSRQPDYRINGDIWDCYSAIEIQKTAWGIRDAIWKKVRKKRQTKRVIVDMTRSPVTLQELSDELAQYPVKDLIEVMVITRK